MMFTKDAHYERWLQNMRADLAERRARMASLNLRVECNAIPLQFGGAKGKVNICDYEDAQGRFFGNFSYYPEVSEGPNARIEVHHIEVPERLQGSGFLAKGFQALYDYLDERHPDRDVLVSVAPTFSDVDYDTMSEEAKQPIFSFYKSFGLCSIEEAGRIPECAHLKPEDFEYPNYLIRPSLRRREALRRGPE